MSNYRTRYVNLILASAYCPETKVAGVSVWIVSDNVRIQKSCFFSNVESKDEADIRAAFFGYIQYHESIRGASILTIQSTSQAVCDAFVDEFREIPANTILWFRKVDIDLSDSRVLFRLLDKASLVDKRGYAYDWCQAEAKQQLEKGKAYEQLPKEKA